MMKNPKVSVCVVTYNHEKYIKECLESIVTQKCDFDFEVIVGDDCSTDNTRVIVQEYVDKYPNIVKPLYHEKNVGPVKNIIEIYRMAKGKFICHMDGDDYALPNKIQIQYNILNNNPDCTICSHDMKLLKDDKILSITFKKFIKGKYTIIDLYKTLPFFAHSSKMFVNDLSDFFWNKLHFEALDIEVHVNQAKKGKIFHLSECLGVYRLGSGVSSCYSRVNPVIVRGVDRIFTEALNEKIIDSNTIKKCYSKAYLNFAYQSTIFNNDKEFTKYIRKSLDIKIISIIQVIMYVLSYTPKIALFLAKIRNLRKYNK